MNAQHTPGPWEFEESVNGGFDITATRHDNGRPCVIAAREQWGSYAKTSKANGRLIAAAPELLEALEGVLPYLEEDPDDEGDYNDRVRAAVAAIAKAKGEA